MKALLAVSIVSAVLAIPAVPEEGQLILEDFEIQTYYAVRDFATCGDIVVEKSGHVVAPIKVGNLTVKGKVQGRVTARGHVHIHKTGYLKGDIEAPALQIDQGAVLDAFVRIGARSDPPA